jgi:hypothetical protein
MEDDFENGMGLPEDELTGGSMADHGDLGLGGMDVEDEMDSEAPGRPSGGARSLSGSRPRKSAAPAPAARKSASSGGAKRKSARPAKKAKKSAKKAARKASRKPPRKASKKKSGRKRKAGRKR